MSDLVDILCDPINKQNLEYVDEGNRELYKNNDSNFYPVVDGIINFLDGVELSGYNRKFQKIYNIIAPIYDKAIALQAIQIGGVGNGRNSIRRIRC